jgi:two-component system, NarL family, response regulator LiaR
MDKIRVLITDDHAILRDGIRSLLERQDDIEVIGEASNGREAVALTGELKPDLVLMDVAMPEMNGLEATRQIKSLYPEVRVLILTQHDDREYIEPALQAGASGYVLKRSGGREVLSAIYQVYESGAFLEPSVARQVMDGYAQPGSDKNRPALTERETEILRMMVDGNTTKEIATLLKISPKTVSVHRSNLMSKLDVRSNLELLRYAAQHGLVDL